MTGRSGLGSKRRSDTVPAGAIGPSGTAYFPIDDAHITTFVRLRLNALEALHRPRVTLRDLIHSDSRLEAHSKVTLAEPEKGIVDGMPKLNGNARRCTRRRQHSLTSDH